MGTEVISVRVDRSIIENLKKSGIDPKKEIKEYLTVLARLIEKRKTAEELKFHRYGTTSKGMVVKWIQEDRER